MPPQYGPARHDDYVRSATSRGLVPSFQTQAYQQPPVNPDIEAQAQAAQWATAYAPKDEIAPGIKRMPGAVSTTATDARNSNTTKPESTEEMTVIRKGGGKQWTDKSLLDWDPKHFRIFVGNLAGEVTDDSLAKAFSRYPSMAKARVVRDARTSKSKGYGFVAFRDGEEYFQAARDMNGKYIGSHPVMIKKAKSDVAPTAAANFKRDKGKNRVGKMLDNVASAGHANGHFSGSGGYDRAESGSGNTTPTAGTAAKASTKTQHNGSADTGAGVQKPKAKAPAKKVRKMLG